MEREFWKSCVVETAFKVMKEVFFQKNRQTEACEPFIRRTNASDGRTENYPSIKERQVQGRKDQKS